MFSYWEQKHFANYDNLIIGAGLAGLFTAINLKRKFPTESILVLDKEMFPAASTKNAGFACMGSITELEDDLSHSSRNDICELFEKRYRGLQLMREELGDENISYKEEGSFELLYEKDGHVIDKMDQWNQDLFFVANRKVFSEGDIRARGFKGFSGIIHNELEGEIDTGSMYLNLKRKAVSLGIEIQMNSPVLNFEGGTHGYNLQLENSFQLKANRLIFCTNAFTNRLLPTMKIKPARGQVLLTKPISDIPFKGIYHFDRGYYYFREIDGRVLFGGGRQLDEKRETTTELSSNALILENLMEKLAEQILPNTYFEIGASWTGIMGKAESKGPITKQLDANLFILAGFGGMGVALVPYAARELVRIIN